MAICHGRRSVYAAFGYAPKGGTRLSTTKSVEKAVHLWLDAGVFTFTEVSSVTRQWLSGKSRLQPGSCGPGSRSSFT